MIYFKSITKLILASLLLISLSSASFGADILGCPNGIMQGALWTRFKISRFDMSKKWDKTSEEMVDIDQGNGILKRDLIKYDFRIGYGVSSRLDVGVELKLATVKTDKKKPLQSIVNFSKHSLTELWFAGKYRFLDKGFRDTLFTYFKMSAGGAFGYGLADDAESLVSGIGPGCHRAQLGLLMHGGILKNKFEFACEIIYQWNGDAPNNTESVDGFTFSRSGENIADQLKYSFVLETPLGRYLGLKVATSGWFGVEHDSKLLKNGDEQFGYLHQVVFGLEIMPFSNDYEKRKLVLQIQIPYKTRVITAPDIALTTIAMFTF